MTERVICRCGNEIAIDQDFLGDELRCTACEATLALPASETVPHTASTTIAQWLRPCGSCLGIALLFIAVSFGTCIFLLSNWFAEGRGELEQELSLLSTSSEPTTATELEEYYTLPNDVSDLTELVVEAVEAASRVEVDDAARGLPFVDRSFDLEQTPLPRPGDLWTQLEDVEAILAKYRPALELLRKAERLGGSARFESDFSLGINADFSILDKIQVTTRLLRLDAYAAVHEGDSTRALQSISIMLLLSETLARYPQIVAQLVRMGSAFSACETATELLPYIDIDDPAVEKLVSTLERQDFNQSLYIALLGERVNGQIAFSSPETIGLSDSIEDADGLRRWSTNGMARDQAFYLHSMRRLISATELPWPSNIAAAKRVATDFELLLEDQNILVKSQYIFSSIFLPALDSMFVATGSAIARRDATTTLIAIERYKRTNGEQPDTLAQLVPEYLEDLPLDPFTNGSLLYSSDHDRVCVYSVGENGRDDGGQPDDYLRLDVVMCVDRISF